MLKVKERFFQALPSSSPLRINCTCLVHFSLEEVGEGRSG